MFRRDIITFLQNHRYYNHSDKDLYLYFLKLISVFGNVLLVIHEHPVFLQHKYYRVQGELDISGPILRLRNMTEQATQVIMRVYPHKSGNGDKQIGSYLNFHMCAFRRSGVVEACSTKELV